MKRIAFVFTFLVVTLNGFAQKKRTGMEGFKIGMGLSLAIPVSNLELNTIGAGLDILAQYGLSDDLAITADAGATALFAKYNIPTTAVIPIRLGIRYFPLADLYLGARAGMGIYTLGDIVSENYTAWSLGAGYFLSKKFEAGASYDGYTKKNTSFGYMALRIGYVF
jgi:hypothetical protein